MKTTPIANYDSLLAELIAIERWDHEYQMTNQHDRSARDAFDGRQRRRMEILSEILQARRSERQDQ